MSKELNLQTRMKLFQDMAMIRKFEEKIAELARERGRVVGMQILALGQEAVAAGVVEAMQPEDVLISNHRSHGHLLAKGTDPGKLMAEIMGKSGGLNKGKAGTLHLADPEVNAILTSTIVGASPLLGMGTAFAQQYNGARDITVVFFGDGASAEGSVHEAMNMASLWSLPVLFVCENNCWAGAQKLNEHSCLQDISKRAAGYDMPGMSVNGNDVEAVFEASLEFIGHCRAGKGPALLEARTYRMRGHGEHDPGLYMDKMELEHWSEHCPLEMYRKKLVGGNRASSDELDALEKKCQELVEQAVRYGDESSYPPAEDALKDLWV